MNISVLSLSPYLSLKFAHGKEITQIKGLRGNNLGKGGGFKRIQSELAPMIYTKITFIMVDLHFKKHIKNKYLLHILSLGPEKVTAALCVPKM